MSTTSTYELDWSVLFNKLKTSGPMAQIYKEVQDSMYESDPFLKLLKAKSMDMWEGGSEILVPVRKSDRKAVTFLKDSEFSVSKQNDITMAKFIPTRFLSAAFMNWTDMEENRSGRNTTGKILDEFKDELMTAKDSIDYAASAQLYGNGTTDIEGDSLTTAINPIQGLQLAIPDTPTSGTYGGITRGSTDNTKFWKSWTLAMTDISSVLNRECLRRLVQICTHKGKRPNVLLTSEEVYNLIHELGKSDKQLLMSPSKKSQELMLPVEFSVFGADVISTKFMTVSTRGGKTSAAQSRIYALNTDSMKLFVSPDGMKVHPPVRGTNQMTWQHNVTYGCCFAVINPMLNAVMTAVTA